MERLTNCPHCDADQQGGLIPEQARAYYGGETHFSRSIMVEMPGVYDGGLYWECPDCGGTWHRWEPGTHLHAVASRMGAPREGVPW